MHQYRITVSGAVGPVADRLPADAWARAADVAEERGIGATLERRLVTDPDILDFFNGDLPAGWMRLGPRVVTAWEVFAEIRSAL